MVEPSGVYWGYQGAATGKGRQAAKAELEKLDLPNISARDAVKEAARIIHLVHEDNKDKDYELEITWVSTSETNGLHKFVPEDLIAEAKQYAEDAENDSGSDSDSESSDEEME